MAGKMSFSEWLEANTRTIWSLFEDFKAETGDTKLSAHEFAVQMFRETVHYQKGV